MPNRYVLEGWSDDAAKFFGVEDTHEQSFSNYNVAPIQVMPVVAIVEGKRVVEPMKWGLVPMWSKEPKVKYSTFNARAEDVFEKPTWRGAARHHRCLIVATAFYEWEHRGSEKQPYYIHPIDQKYFAFAGIYDEWHGELLTYSIVTTIPNKEMSKLHNRMPVILHPKDWDTWLNPSRQTRDSVEPLLRPYEDGKLKIFKVSRDVNNTRNNDEHLIYPLQN